MKKCSKCGVEKLLKEFHKNITRKDGFEYWCKSCSKERRAKYHHLPRVKKKEKERYAQNKEKFRNQAIERYHALNDEQPGCIYQIKNVLSSKVYIGETLRGKLRWNQHLKRLRGQRHKNIKLQQDFNEHGEGVFEWSIIKELPKDKELLLLEEAIEIQRRLNNGEDLYNLSLTIEQLKMLQENK